MKMTRVLPGRLSFACVAVAAAAGSIFLLSLSSAEAGRFRNGQDMRDMVTGYKCIGTCQTVRLPYADCICLKMNPGETDIRKLELQCWGMEHRRWVACPVKLRYAIPAN
ncbi:MAG: hypothetical protein L0I29_16560 [Hyphomicrobiales bacterium]|nr:hypothetical protein [Hyphomicrobiales bacterium]